jgi:hypothetical protein
MNCGSRPIDRKTLERSRTNIFAFVVHQAGDTWLCASAHNTDVAPLMETNVVDDDGAFRAANYRTGQLS